MQRIILISFILILPKIGLSQDYSVLVDKPFDLASEVKIADYDKLELLSKAKSLSPFKDILDYGGQIDSTAFHFFNFDTDENIEMIYYGFAGAESNITIIIDNDQDKLKILDQFLGKLVSIDGSEQNGIENIQILELPCCADYVYHLLTYSWNNLLSEYEVIDDISFIRGTEFPKKLTIKKRFKTINNS